MSADDYNVEPTGTLGLTSAELVLVGNELSIFPVHRGMLRDERLFTATISRPTLFTVEHEQESVRADLNLRCQEMLDNVDPCRSGESIPHAETTSYDCKGPGNLKRPRKALAFRIDKTGSLVRTPSFCQCSCSRCQQMVIPADTGDQDSATRKPIPYGEGSRDVTDVLTLTYVPTRPPMYDATGAEKLGVEMSCPSEASSQDAEMSCPSEASSQDVRPVVSTADAMPFNQVVSTADAMLLSQVMSTADAKTLSQETRSVERVAAPLILCDGTTRIARSQFVNDAGLSIEQDRLAYSNVLQWRPQPRRVPQVDGFHHHLDDGGYLSDGQQHMDDRREWHGKKRFLSIDRGLCIPSYTLKLRDHRDDDSEKFLVPCRLIPNEKGLLLKETSE